MRRKKIDDKLKNLDKGLENLTEEVRNNDKKQDKNNRRLENRLKTLEINAGRHKFERTKRNSGEELDGTWDKRCQQAGQRGTGE